MGAFNKMNAIILGKNIQLPVLLGIVNRSKEEEVEVIFCTPSQESMLKRLGLGGIQFQLMLNLKWLNKRINEREISFVVERINSFNCNQLFVAGEVNQAWLIAAVKSGHFLTQWEKSFKVVLDDLIAFTEMTKKEIPDRKKIGIADQFMIRNSNKIDVVRFFPLRRVAVVRAMSFPSAMNFLALGLKERVVHKVLVLCEQEPPNFAHEWAEQLPSTLTSGGGFGSITLTENGFESIWVKQVFSKIEVISEKKREL